MKRSFIHVVNSFKNLSIRNKMVVIYIVTIVLPMLLIYYVSYNNSVNIIRAQIKNSLLNLSEQINRNIESKLKQMEVLSSLLYSSELLREIVSKDKYQENTGDLLWDNREFEKLFTYILYQSSDIESIYVFTSNNNIFYKSYNGQMKLDYDPAGEEWFKKIVAAQGETVFFGVHTPWPLFVNNSKVISLGREIQDFGGKSLGIMVIDLKLDFLNEIIKKSVKSYKSEFLIIDENGNIVYSDQGKLTDNIKSPEVINKLIKSKNSTAIEDIDGVKSFLTFKTSSFPGWNFISITPETEISSHTSQFLKLNILITIISLSIYSMLIIMLYITIYNPIQRLTYSMNKVEQGNFNVSVTPESSDEIGRLCTNFNHMLEKINELIENEYKSAILKKDAEFKALQSQINPHFLYNCLQSISSIAVVKKVPEVNKISKSLGYMLRYSIKTKGDIVPFEQELEHVKSYLTIQKIRLEDKVNVKLNVSQEVYKYSIIKLVLQPFMENAFNHGVDKKRGVSEVELSAVYSDGYMIIKIKDSGIGMDREKLESIRQSLSKAENAPAKINTASIGIYNVNSRLKLYYGSKYSLSIESSPGTGTEVTLKIPAMLDNGEGQYV